MAQIIITLTDEFKSFFYDLEMPNDLKCELLLNDIVETLNNYDESFKYDAQHCELLVSKYNLKPIELNQTLEDINVFNGDYLVLKNSNDVEHVRETENFYKQPVLKFSSLNPNDGISFSINKPQFKIGKKATIVDGAISFNNAISRVHCQVEYKNNKFYIVDLNSANGTYLNKHKLDSNKLYELKNKDNIRLANSDFIVEF